MQPEESNQTASYSPIVLAEGDIIKTFESKYGYSTWWSTEGFLAEDYLNKSAKPIVEVGGPTEKRYRLVDLKEVRKKLHTSNIQKGVAEYHGKTGEFLGFGPQADFQADSRKLPLADESVSAIFDSNLYGPTREQTIDEAARVLEKGGLLVWQGGQRRDFNIARKRGFELVQYNVRDQRQGFLSFDTIFRKPKDTSAGREEPFDRVINLANEYADSPHRMIGGWSREINFFITDNEDFPKRIAVSLVDEDGKKLTSREVINRVLKEYGRLGLEIPNYDTETGEKLTNEQKVIFLKTFQHVLSQRYPDE